MLYDPNWSVIPRPRPDDVFSLENLIAWLETMPADQQYDFCDLGQCLLAQWALSVDPQSLPTGIGAYEYIVHGSVIDLSRFKTVAINHDTGRTFGEALERVRPPAKKNRWRFLCRT